jgi:hypothetical protein
MAKSGSIEFNLNADETFEALCAAILAEGHHLTIADFSNLTAVINTKMMLYGAGPIDVAVTAASDASSVIHFLGNPGPMQVSSADRTVGKIVARISDPASRQIVVQQQANAIAQLKTMYKSVVAELDQAKADPVASHFENVQFREDQKDKDQAMGCAVVGLGAAAILVGVIVLGVLSWTPESAAASICKDHLRDRLRNPQSGQFSDQIVSGGPTRFNVSWQVQAENGFGGMNRSRQRCTVIFAEEPSRFGGTSHSVF